MQERKGKPAGPPGQSASASSGSVANVVPEPALATTVPADAYEATVTAGPSVGADSKEGDEVSMDGGRQARAALDLLSSLLGGPGKDVSAPFRLALFSGDDSAGGGASSSGDGGLIISFDAKDDARLQEMIARLGLDDDGREAGGGKEAPDDDLLAMMDAAAGGK